MIILTIRTDKPLAEVALYDDTKPLAEINWEAHRQLSDTIHTKILELLQTQNMDWVDIRAIIAYKGPGSFTGLRIGMSVANALSYGLAVPIVSQNGEDWVTSGANRLMFGEDEKVAIPNYGADAHITAPKK
jgi:tRNA threonylcarbamoyladenosine biosynthesis protein TsaB